MHTGSNLPTAVRLPNTNGLISPTSPMLSAIAETVAASTARASERIVIWSIGRLCHLVLQHRQNAASVEKRARVSPRRHAFHARNSSSALSWLFEVPALGNEAVSGRGSGRGTGGSRPQQVPHELVGNGGTSACG